MADAATLASALEDRSYTGNILPFKTDKAGALSFAVPEMLQSLYRGGKELLNGPRATSPGQTSLSPDALGALAAMMGIPGMATAERGAVGVAGGRLPSASLPMDEASRMARADAGGIAKSIQEQNILSAPSVRERASELEALLKNTFPELKTEVRNSVTPIGKSSYLSFHYQPQGFVRGKYTTGEVRISDHAVGPGRAGDYVDHVMVDEPYSADGLLEKIRASIERTNAAFDPAKKDSADLLAASGPAVLAAAPKSRRDLLAEQISKVEK